MLILPNQSLKIDTAPSEDPVTLDEAKLFLRIDGTDEDALITSLITAATRKVENYLDRFLITQTWDVWLDFIPLEKRDARNFGGNDWWDGVLEGPISWLRKEPDLIQLPRGPVQSVSSFTVYDKSDSSSAFTDFNLDNITDAARVYLKENSQWPTDLRSRNAIQIKTVYGYGDNGSDVPADIITAIKIILSEIYNDRGCGDCSGKQYQPNGKADNMNKNASCLLDPYVIERLE